MAQRQSLKQQLQTEEQGHAQLEHHLSALQQQVNQANQVLHTQRATLELRNSEAAATQSATASAVTQRGSVAAELEQANAERHALNLQLQTAQSAWRACTEASASARQRLRTLEDMQGALRMVVCEEWSQFSFAMTGEANQHASQAREDLQTGVAQCTSKTSAAQAETEALRKEHFELTAAITSLREEHAAMEARQKANLAAFSVANANATALQARFLETKAKLEELERHNADLRGKDDAAQAEIHTQSSQLEAIGSTYHCELESLLPVLERRRVEKSEADSCHARRRVEIEEANQAPLPPASVTFVAGQKLGVSVEDRTGAVVGVSLGGQAAEAGVEKGWRVVATDGRAYSPRELHQCANGDKNFVIDFNSRYEPMEASCAAPTRSIIDTLKERHTAGSMDTRILGSSGPAGGG